MTEIERLNEALKEAFDRIRIYRKGDMATYLGYKGPYFSGIINGKEKISDQFLKTISEKLQINKDWITKGEGEKFISNRNLESDAEIYETPEGIIKAPLIGQYANGGYLRGYSDPEYLEDQPPFYSTRKHTGGNYVAFEVRGDSMDSGTRDAICEGDILLGRELSRQYWNSKFHIPKVFIIVHRSEGITVKEVTEHDVETGRLRCHCWNKDPEYQDFDLYLKDIVQLFYIKEVSRNFKL